MPRPRQECEEVGGGRGETQIHRPALQETWGGGEGGRAAGQLWVSQDKGARQERLGLAATALQSSAASLCAQHWACPEVDDVVFLQEPLPNAVIWGVWSLWEGREWRKGKLWGQKKMPRLRETARQVSAAGLTALGHTSTVLIKPAPTYLQPWGSSPSQIVLIIPGVTSSLVADSVPGVCRELHLKV